MNVKLEQEVRKLMLREENNLPEANPMWMQMKIELFSNEDVFDGLARCAGYVRKAEIKKPDTLLKMHYPAKEEKIDTGFGLPKEIPGKFIKPKKTRKARAKKRKW